MFAIQFTPPLMLSPGFFYTSKFLKQAPFFVPAIVAKTPAGRQDIKQDNN